MYASEVPVNGVATIHMSDLPRDLAETLQEVESDGAGDGLVGMRDGSGGPTDHLLDNTETSARPEDRKLGQIARYVKFIVGKMAADAAYENANQEWEELGRVIDRLLFIAFFVLYIFTAAALL